MLLPDQPFANDLCSHWDWLLNEITGGEIGDEHGTDPKITGYGLVNVYKDLDKEYALFNAESYVSPSFLSDQLYSYIVATRGTPPRPCGASNARRTSRSPPKTKRRMRRIQMRIQMSRRKMMIELSHRP